MAGEAAMGKVAEAGAERLRGGPVSRTSALLASTVVGVGAAVLTYKLLRSGDDE
jgi:hypothetical protein